MNILHTFCQNYNFVDYALFMGVKNLLRDTFNIDLIAINEVNKRYDLFVIGYGGIIHSVIGQNV